MKTKNITKFVVLATIVFFSACNLSAKKKVVGSGNVIKENRTCETFNQIKCYGTFNVYLSQGQKEEVVIEADDNIVPLIKTEFKNGILEVKNTEGYRFERTTKMNVYITIVDLNELHFHGVGELKSLTDLNLTSLYLTNNGVGDIEIHGKANDAKIKNNGVGDVNVFEFVVERVELYNAGVGDVEVNATQELKLVNSGVGDVKYKAGAKMIDIESNGIGSVRKK